MVSTIIIVFYFKIKHILPDSSSFLSNFLIIVAEALPLLPRTNPTSTSLSQAEITRQRNLRQARVSHFHKGAGLNEETEKSNVWNT